MSELRNPICWPIHTMAGATWNILDDTGCRIAICGYDNDHEKSGPPIAARIVERMRDYEWLVEIAFRAGDISHARAAELLGVSAQNIQERGWKQGDGIEETEQQLAAEAARKSDTSAIIARLSGEPGGPQYGSVAEMLADRVREKLQAAEALLREIRGELDGVYLDWMARCDEYFNAEAEQTNATNV